MIKRPRVDSVIYDEIMKYDGKSFNECLLSYMHNHNVMSIAAHDGQCNDKLRMRIERSREVRLLKSKISVMYFRLFMVSLCVVGFVLWSVLS